MSWVEGNVKKVKFSLGELVTVWSGKDYYDFTHVAGMIVQNKVLHWKTEAQEVTLYQYLILVNDKIHWYSEDAVRKLEESACENR